MRTFKHENVVKITDSDKKASQLLEQGYTEVVEVTTKKPRIRKNGGDDNDGQSEQTQDAVGD